MNAYQNKIYRLLVLFTATFLLSCSENELTVKTEFKQINFNELKTYRWYEKSGFDEEGPITEITYGMIQQAIDIDLKGKRFKKISGTDVDFYVNTTLTAKKRAGFKSYQVYSGVGEGFGYSEGSNGFQALQSSERQTDMIVYREGVLLIDIIDSKTDKLIWRGVANKKLPEVLNKDQSTRKARIAEAVEAVLNDFPPTSTIK